MNLGVNFRLGMVTFREAAQRLQSLAVAVNAKRTTK